MGEIGVFFGDQIWLAVILRCGYGGIILYVLYFWGAQYLCVFQGILCMNVVLKCMCWRLLRLACLIINVFVHVLLK